MVLTVRIPVLGAIDKAVCGATVQKLALPTIVYVTGASRPKPRTVPMTVPTVVFSGTVRVETCARAELASKRGGARRYGGCCTNDRLMGTVAVSVKIPAGWDTASTNNIHRGCTTKSSVEQATESAPVVALTEKQAAAAGLLLALRRYETNDPASWTQACRGAEPVEISGVLQRRILRSGRPCYALR